MSYICKDKDTLLLIKDFLITLDSNGLKYGNLNQRDIYEFLRQILPRTSNNIELISCVVNERGDRTAYFNQQLECIFVNLDKVLVWLKDNIDYLFNVTEELEVDRNKLAKYLMVFILAHEVEHGYQYLIGKEIVLAPCTLLQSAYRELFDLLVGLNERLPFLKQINRNVRRNIYVKNREQFLLERNANVEAYDLLSRFALFVSDEEMYKLFSWLKDGYEGIGYTQNRKGCLINTYDSLFMSSHLWFKQKDDIDLSEEEKVRYGLRVTEKTRKKVLEKAMVNI